MAFNSHSVVAPAGEVERPSDPVGQEAVETVGEMKRADLAGLVKLSTAHGMDVGQCGGEGTAILLEHCQRAIKYSRTDVAARHAPREHMSDQLRVRGKPVRIVAERVNKRALPFHQLAGCGQKPIWRPVVNRTTYNLCHFSTPRAGRRTMRDHQGMRPILPTTARRKRSH